MTYGFASLFVGSLLLLSAVRNRSLVEVLRGITAPKAGGPGSGFLASIVGSAVATGAATTATANAAAGAVAGGANLPTGIVNFEGTPMCAWIAAELAKARQRGWKGSVTSGYRSAADQARVCATTTNPCAAPGTSNHQGTHYPSCAVDVTDPAGLASALPPGSPLRYTGASIGDTVHFSSGQAGV